MCQPYFSGKRNITILNSIIWPVSTTGQINLKSRLAYSTINPLSALIPKYPFYFFLISLNLSLKLLGAYAST